MHPPSSPGSFYQQTYITHIHNSLQLAEARDSFINTSAASSGGVLPYSGTVSLSCNYLKFHFNGICGGSLKPWKAVGPFVTLNSCSTDCFKTYNISLSKELNKYKFQHHFFRPTAFYQCLCKNWAKVIISSNFRSKLIFLLFIMVHKNIDFISIWSESSQFPVR